MMLLKSPGRLHLWR